MVINRSESLLLHNSWLHHGSWPSGWSRPCSRDGSSAHRPRSICWAHPGRYVTEDRVTPPCSLPGLHGFPKTIKPWMSPHTNTNIYRLKIRQKESLLITQRITGIQSVQYLCQKSRMFLLWALIFFLNSVPGLLQYIFYLDPLLNLSNFICDLTRTYQSIRDWKVFRIMLGKQTFPISLCHSNHHLCHICRNCQRKSKETLCVILGW